jgi:hypothetical protein
MGFPLPPQLFDNLAKGEEIVRGLKTRSLLNIPEYTFLTDRRIIYFNKKVLKRFDFIDIPYARLSSMRAERGLLISGSIRFESEDGEKVSLQKIPRKELEDFVLSLEIAINNVAVEAIKIRRKKGLGGRMVWEFKKTPEMIFRSRPPDAGALSYRSREPQKPSDDPLTELKLRLARGEITMEEYVEMEKLLRS